MFVIETLRTIRKVKLMPAEIAPGTEVRVINPNHWLFDKTGHVAPMSLEGRIKKQMAGAAPMADIGVVVDFEKNLHGWYKTPLEGERKARTHRCDGALRHATGYYILQRDLAIVDAPGGLDMTMLSPRKK